MQSLHTDPAGLSEAEAERRLKEFGPNIIQGIRTHSFIKSFLGSFTHFFAMILWAGAAIALVAHWNALDQGMGILALAIVCVIVINGLFSFWQEYQAEQAIEALKKLIPHETTVVREGKMNKIATESLVPGDVICVADGDDIPADCRVIEEHRLRVNNATISGESIPVSRISSPVSEDDLTKCQNILLAGTSVFSGEARAVVFNTGMHTAFGKIAGLTQAVVQMPSPLRREIARLSKIIAVIAVTVGLFFYLIGSAIGLPTWDNAVFALGIIVALVPEGLLPEVTLALASCAHRMAMRNALVRNLSAVETLGCTTVICTDKTGTLTQNRMSVRELFAGGKVYSITSDRNRRVLQSDEQNRLVGEITANCHGLKQLEHGGITHLSGDPMDMALVQYGAALQAPAQEYERIDDIPFDPVRKRQSVVAKSPDGPVLYTKGALDTILPLCGAIQNTHETEELSDALKEELQTAEKNMAERGLRVLALAHKKLTSQYRRTDDRDSGRDSDRDIESGLIFVALVGLEDPPRAEVPEAIAKCRKAGIKTIMVTGDHPNTAAAIAREIGMTRSDTVQLITGDRLKHMSLAELQLALDSPEIIFARLQAEQKMRIVEALKEKGHIVAVTGDGVNDAPALRSAHIGVAMGLSGTDVAKESADMVLADDNFASIVAAVEEGRNVFLNIRKFLTYVLASNVAELIPCLAFVVFKIPLPLATIQILSIDLGTDVVPALALGTEACDSTVMDNPPRKRTDRLVEWSLLARAYLFLGLLVSIGSMAAYFFTLNCGGWHFGEALPHDGVLYRQATTACLAGIMCMQAVNSSMCRSEKRSIGAIGLFANRMLLIGVVLQTILMFSIVYSPAGNLILRTAPLPAKFWLFILPFMVALVLLEEGRKWIVCRFHNYRPQE